MSVVSSVAWNRMLVRRTARKVRDDTGNGASTA